MAARNPEEIDRLFERELNAGNLDGLAALYEPSAAFTVEPGKVVTGTAAIREALAGFLSLKPRITLTPRVLANAGDVAMVSSKWTLKGSAPDGAGVDLSGESAEVLRRQADGTWKFVIDSPWGSRERLEVRANGAIRRIRRLLHRRRSASPSRRLLLRSPAREVYD